MAKESVVAGSLGAPTCSTLSHFSFMETALHSDAAVLNLKGNGNEDSSRALLDMNRIKRIHTVAFLSSFRPAC